jgi:hypothetical protein
MYIAEIVVAKVFFLRIVGLRAKATNRTTNRNDAFAAACLKWRRGSSRFSLSPDELNIQTNLAIGTPA